jgi:hypothetical protein
MHPGADILFNGSSLKRWQLRNGKQPTWDIVSEGAMQVGDGDIVSKQLFSDALIHLEFKTPFMPEARGQARGNSGVYVHGRYEIQVLDSFGLPPRDNGCGGIYQAAVPLVNASLPPEEWQTYDIEFRAPRFDSSGKKTQNARITVHHNGILIHDDVELPGPTPGGIDNVESSEGPLLLQDHGNPVQYRNIWIKIQ